MIGRVELLRKDTRWVLGTPFGWFCAINALNMRPYHIPPYHRKNESIFSYLWTGVKIGLFMLLVASQVFLFQRVLYLEASLKDMLMEKIASEGMSQEKLLYLENLTVRVIGENGEGSGFILDPKGYVVTNSHVVANTFRPKIAFNGGGFSTAKIYYNNEEKDIAILQADNIPPEIVLNYCYFSTGNPIGEDIIILGYPLGRNVPGSPTMTKGHISAIRSWNDGGFVYQIGASVNEGNSGGPVFDRFSELVGIVTATIGYKSGMGLVIPSEQIKEAYNEALLKSDEVGSYDESKIDLKSHIGVVTAFYSYQESRQLNKAYDLLSKNFVGNMPFEKWEQGYANTLNIFTYQFKDEDTNKVGVKFASTDLVKESFVTKYFEGSWLVKDEGGVLRLFEANIEEIKDPDYMWFYE